MADKTVAVKIDVNAKSLGELEGDLKGVNKQVDQLESNVAGLSVDQKFKAAQGAIKGFAGAVEAAVGAVGLLGIESKIFDNYERYALATISFGRGIFDMAEGMSDLRESGVLANIMLKSQNALNKVTAASAKALGIATNTASTAFKGLRAAIAATGIGLLVVAIGFAIEKLMMMADATDQAKKATDDFNASLKENEDLLNDQLSSLDAVLQTELLLAEEAGEAEQDLEDKRTDQHGQRMLRYDEAEARAKDALVEARKFGEEEIKNAQDTLDKIEEAREKDERNENNRRIQRRINIKKQAAAEAKIKLDAEDKFQKDKQAFEITYREETATTQEQFEYNELERVNNHYDELIELAEKYGFDVSNIVNKREQELTRLATKQDLIRKQRAEELANEISEINTTKLEDTLRIAQMMGASAQSVLEGQQQLERERLENLAQSELLSLKNRLDAELITIEEYTALKIATEQRYSSATAALKLEQAEQSRLLAEQEKIIALELKDYKVSLARQTGDDISFVLQTLFAENKAVAIAGTTIEAAGAIAGIVSNTAVANARALAELGPIAGVPVVAAQKIAAGASIAAVLAQKGKTIADILKTSKDAPAGGAGSTGIPSGPSAASGERGDFTQGPVPQPEAASACMRTYVLTGDVTSGIEAEAKLSRKRNIA